MPPLVIDLQDGFAGDTVVVCVDGEEVLRERGVSTDYAIGLAAHIERDVLTGPARVEIQVPSRGLSHALTVGVAEATYVAVSIAGGEIVHRLLDEPPMYF